MEKVFIMCNEKFESIDTRKIQPHLMNTDNLGYVSTDQAQRHHQHVLDFWGHLPFAAHRLS
jgi:hypothetical protein